MLGNAISRPRGLKSSHIFGLDIIIMGCYWSDYDVFHRNSMFAPRKGMSMSRQFHILNVHYSHPAKYVRTQRLWLEAFKSNIYNRARSGIMNPTYFVNAGCSLTVAFLKREAIFNIIIIIFFLRSGLCSWLLSHSSFFELRGRNFVILRTAVSVVQQY
jgi:hypothetical protein